MTVWSFDHITPAQRVIFAADEVVHSVDTALEAVGSRRAALIAGRSATGVAHRLGALSRVIDVRIGVSQHVPRAEADGVLRDLDKIRPDALLTVGGGSATGLGKVIARETRLPLIAVPTSFSGSEATDVWGETNGGRKTTGSDPAALPRVVIYDPGLFVSLPRRTAVASALNAVAHAVDSVWGPRVDPIDVAVAMQALSMLTTTLRGLPAGRLESDWLGPLVTGSYLAATAFAGAGPGLHHKICHVLGGRYGLDHAGMHSALLPYVAGWNVEGVPEMAAVLQVALGGTAVERALFDLQAELGAPSSLMELGMAEDDIPEAAELILPFVPPGNPRPVTRRDMEELLRRAWAGGIKERGEGTHDRS